MDRVSSGEQFKQSLSSLTLAQQRQVGARFIGNVLDLTDGRCTEQARKVAAKSDVSTEELEQAYRAVHTVYVATHPQSDLSELDFRKQAAHFVAEACMVCVAPTYEERDTHHLAERVAGYCRMARICSSIQHQEEYPKFMDAEVALKNEIDAQYRILNEFLESR